MRCWRQSDHPVFAAINRDPKVMEFIGSPLSEERSDALVDRIEAGFGERGFGLWALEAVGVAPFIGFAGLNVPQFEAPFTPAVEVGWRLDSKWWGHGFATEAGRAALNFAFDRLELPEIVSFTAQGNVRSRRVMERLGMTRDTAEDFDHPLVPEGSKLRRHVLYRIRREDLVSRLPNKRIEQNARRSAGSRQVGRVCSCAVRWADASAPLTGDP